jgi:malonyl-CoA O-methyltransferase
MNPERPPTIDPVAARRWAAMPPAASPWLHEEVARRMEDRLQWIRLQPAAWAHWGAVQGGMAAHALLRRRYPAAACFVVEQDAARQRFARDALATRWWQPASWRMGAQHFAQPAAQGVDMLWSNMALHASADPQALIAQWQSALATNGFLMFSCLGPDTLGQVRALYRAQGWPPPVHEFTDMHDWGDMLVQAGFAEPVMDMERITLSFATPQRALQELRELGRNLHPARFGGLRGRGWQQQLLQGLAGLPAPGAAGLSLSFEIIYGHALKAAPRVRLSAESAVSLQDMQAMLRGGRVPQG